MCQCRCGQTPATTQRCRDALAAAGVRSDTPSNDALDHAVSSVLRGAGGIALSTPRIQEGRGVERAETAARGILADGKIKLHDRIVVQIKSAIDGIRAWWHRGVLVVFEIPEGQ
jgi:hypothetical protein